MQVLQFEFPWLWAYQRVIGWMDEYEMPVVHRRKPRAFTDKVDEAGINAVIRSNREL